MTTEQILLDIRARRGTLTPAIVVEEATPKGSPLHDRLDWNDKTAGASYRLVQAREIIRSVKVRRLSDEEMPARDLRGFIHVAAAEDDPDQMGEYVPVDEVVSDPRLSALVETQMKRELNALTRRYSTYQEYRALLATEAERLAS